jgi:hypothetical protein
MFSSFASKAKDALSSSDVVETQWNKFEGTVIKSLSAVTEDQLRDDEAMSGLLEGAYELMPLPFRLVVSSKKFVEFGLKKNQYLVEKVAAYNLKHALPSVEQVEHETVSTGVAVQSPSGPNGKPFDAEAIKARVAERNA